MINLDLKDIRNHLQNLGIDVQLQQETNQLFFLKKIAKTDYPIFIRIVEESELLQVLAFLPFNLVPKTIADTARILHLLNKELDVPGFGMDETSSTIFYRCMLSVRNQKVDTDLLEAYIKAIEFVCNAFVPIVGSIVQGITSYDEAVKKAKSAGAIS